MKRFFAYLLVLCLLMACVPAAMADALQGYTSSWDNYGLSKDPITMTVGMGAQDLPTSDIDNILIELIANATGINIEWVGYDPEKFAVLTAGGDLPDVFSMESSTMATELIDSGVALDMVPYLDQYADNIHQVHDSYALTWAKNLYGNGEAIYFIPSNTLYTGGQQFPKDHHSYDYWVRWDIYQAIGAPAITDENGFNEDMLLDVFKQMQDYAREKTGDDSIYALSGWSNWGTIWAAVIPYGMFLRHKINSYADELTGMVEDIDLYGDANSHYYDALRFYNKAWRMGILDPEMFTLTSGQYGDKVKLGKVLVSNSSGYAPNQFDQSVKDVFGDDVALFMIKGMPYFWQLTISDSPVGYGLFASDWINANNANPERAVALLDYLRSDEFVRANTNGLQGIHWDYDETGKPVYIGAAAEAYAAGTIGEFFAMGNGNYKQFPAHKLSMATKLCADGFLNDFTASADYTADYRANDQLVQDYIAFYGSNARYEGELFMEWVEEGVAGVAGPFNPMNSFKPARSDDLNSLASKCETYFNDNSPKVVFAETEEEAEAAIAKMVEDELAMGSADLLADELAREAESAKIAAELGF